jgi:phage baseplate assembly protein W
MIGKAPRSADGEPDDDAKAFLGRGFAFPVVLDADGRFATAAYEEDIRQAIWIILSTAKGERVMRPDFGCGIHDLVFETMDAGTIGRVEATVRAALVRYEHRIELIQVLVSARDAANGRLDIRIDYRVRGTNHEFNLVFPFYLKEGVER